MPMTFRKITILSLLAVGLCLTPFFITSNSGFNLSSAEALSKSQSSGGTGETKNRPPDADTSDWPSDSSSKSEDGCGGPCNVSGTGEGGGAFNTITTAQKEAALATWQNYYDRAASMTSAQALAYSRSLTGSEKLAFEIARGAYTGRTTVVRGNSIDVESCSNGLGGGWEVVDPKIINPPAANEDSNWPPENNDDPAAVCTYLLVNNKAGNVTISEPGPVTLSWQVNYAQSGTITPEPGAFNKRVGSASVNVTKDTVFELKTSNAYGSDSCAVNVTIGEGENICTDADATNYLETGSCIYPAGGSGNPVVTAIIEAAPLIDGLVGYSGNDRYIAASNAARGIDYPIYLRWQGVQSNGKLANYCIGTTPEDYTAPGNAAKGSFEEGDGRGTPYPGLENGESKTYTVQCFNDYGSDTDSVTLTGITDFTGQPPTITADGKTKLAIVPYGKEVEIAWNPNGNLSCSLSNNLSTDISNPATSNTSGALPGSDSPAKGRSSTSVSSGETPGDTGRWFNNTQTSAGSPAKGRSSTPSVTLPGSEKVRVTGESTYTITCEGGKASVRVLALPVIEET